MPDDKLCVHNAGDQYLKLCANKTQTPSANTALGNTIHMLLYQHRTTI